jgi:hypothetical protein
VFFNHRLRDALKAFARARGARCVDTVRELFTSLPFPLLETESYPYMVPSIAKDFRARNLAIHRVAGFYSRIVRHFDALSGHVYTALLADFESHFTSQFQRLLRFAEEEAAREPAPRTAAALPAVGPRPAAHRVAAP